MFWSVLISVKALDFKGNLIEIKRDEIKFAYRGTNLPENLILLSAKLSAKNGDTNLINEKILKFNKEKKESQPSQIKTCGSTFKNHKDKKAWKLIKDSNCNLLSYGKASISKKHCNFFVNEGGASSEDIEKLIEQVFRLRQNGHSIRYIANELKISTGTVQNACAKKVVENAVEKGA